MYFIRDNIKKNPNFIIENKNDLAASIQNTIIEILMDKLKKAITQTGIKQIAVSGGVSANSGLRNTLISNAKDNNLDIFLPNKEFSTDNAAMIAITGYFKYLNNDFVEQDISPVARLNL